MNIIRTLKNTGDCNNMENYVGRKIREFKLNQKWK